MNGATAVVSLAAAATLIGLAFFISHGAIVAHQEGTERITACVEAGGTWLDQYNICVNN